MEKILVVEDDSALAMGIEFALKNDNFEVKVSNTLKNGEESFKEGDFDLILLDVMLPDGSGYDLCKRIREKSEVPIIFLTACDEEVNIILGLDIGGDDYITKPFRVRELISRIKAALRRSPLKNEGKKNLKNYIKSNEIIIYPLETRVQKNGEDLVLTPVEYKLLSTFMQNPMLTLTRDKILEKLWDIEGEFVDDNTLSVYIRRLREKLEDDPSKPSYIVTLRGLGYKWNAKSE